LDVRTFEANAFGAKALNDVPFVVSDQSAAGAGAAAATAAQSGFEYCQYKKGRRSSHRPLAMTPCRGPDVYTKSPSSLSRVCGIEGWRNQRRAVFKTAASQRPHAIGGKNSAIFEIRFPIAASGMQR
jgi:hypothetical protein